MRAKEYLRQLPEARKALECRMNHIKELKANISYMKGMRYDAVRVQTSPSGESLPQKQVEELADMERQLLAEMVKYHKLRYKITREIEQLPDERFREVLILRYVEGMSLREVAEKMGYSQDRIKHIHGYSLLSFTQMHLNQHLAP